MPELLIALLGLLGQAAAVNPALLVRRRRRRRRLADHAQGRAVLVPADLRLHPDEAPMVLRVLRAAP
ncbi:MULTISPECIES: hypothetical protein [unclassified Streptomyces]|uniref:hypothetical protein n=1 Tax=unclassified Streptomyces TaxID=2593676 RepID=UPI000DC78731|nr:MULTISPECIES: hypothetical protein [unclassified Streptomyces]AWZ07507.1 hypothetical protein DRB89_26120 [Streptomyces sp. ICC4]AWZ15499.1 hypothetical protein DRB96_28170 [Streptomyces sp. ICC1]